MRRGKHTRVLQMRSQTPELPQPYTANVYYACHLRHWRFWVRAAGNGGANGHSETDLGARRCEEAEHFC